MIKLENTILPAPQQWMTAILGARNAMNSWTKSDSYIHMQNVESTLAGGVLMTEQKFVMGPNDHDLAMRLAKGGSVHAKYRRMIAVYVDITAPLYWWKEFDTYKVGTVANSCSTMHKIHAKEFTLEDFSCEKLIDFAPEEVFDKDPINYNEVSCGISVLANDGNTGCLAVVSHSDYYEGHSYTDTLYVTPKDILDVFVIPALNANRNAFLKTKDKKYWDQMIQLLPSSYNQKRTVMLNYEVLVGMYRDRKNHKLDEWRELCKWIEELPYSELITGEVENGQNSD